MIENMKGAITIEEVARAKKIRVGSKITYVGLGYFVNENGEREWGTCKQKIVIQKKFTHGVVGQRHGKNEAKFVSYADIALQRREKR